MTPSEKAADLYKKYRYAVKITNIDSAAKHAALMCCDEVIKQDEIWSKATKSGGGNYWREVKKEIQGWKPCGEGENICNCKKESECGYTQFYKEIATLK